MSAAHDPADLQRICDARFSSNIEYRKRVWEALCGDWFQRFVGEKVTIFDVGYGYGELSNAVRAGAESDEQSLRHRPSNAHRAAVS